MFVDGKSAGVRSAKKEEWGATIFTWENIELLQDKENTVKAIAVFCDGSQKEDCVTWIGR